MPSRGRITARSSRKPLIPSPFLKPFFAIFQRQPSREPNMSPFRLLNLPPELRDPIHESILLPGSIPTLLVSSRRAGSARKPSGFLHRKATYNGSLPVRVRPERQAPHLEVAALNSASCCPAKIPVRAVSRTLMPFCPPESRMPNSFHGLRRLQWRRTPFSPCLWTWIGFGSRSSGGH